MAENMDHYLGKLGTFITTKAAGLENSAAFGGEMGDRGADRLRELWAAYMAGWRHSGPETVKSLKPSVQEFLRETDEEYGTYQRLKAKFG